MNEADQWHLWSVLRMHFYSEEREKFLRVRTHVDAIKAKGFEACNFGVLCVLCGVCTCICDFSQTREEHYINTKVQNIEQTRLPHQTTSKAMNAKMFVI